jgi:Flp pilus assembly protein CpaB
VKRSNRLVILVGLLLAVLAFVAIVILLNSQDTPEEEVEVTETVLVANEDLDIGEPITPDKVREEAVDPEAVQGTPLRDTSEVSGQPALFAIPQDAQVTAAAIGRSDAETVIDVSSQLLAGEKAVSIQVDRLQGANFLVQPGDTIDVILTLQLPPTLNPDPLSVRTVKTVLQDKRVVYVSTDRSVVPEPQDTNGDGVIDENDQQPEQLIEDQVIVIFAGTSQDAEVVRYAQRTSSEFGDQVSAATSLVIRSDEDDDVIEDTPGITIQELIEEYAIVIPEIEGLLDPEIFEETPAEEPVP